MLIETLIKVKNYNAQSKHFDAPYLSSEDMENIEYALEKQTPKKVLTKLQTYDGCPVCKNKVYESQVYCDRCGQRLER